MQVSTNVHRRKDCTRIDKGK